MTRRASRDRRGPSVRRHNQTATLSAAALRQVGPAKREEIPRRSATLLWRNERAEISAPRFVESARRDRDRVRSRRSHKFPDAASAHEILIPDARGRPPASAGQARRGRRALRAGAGAREEESRRAVRSRDDPLPAGPARRRDRARAQDREGRAEIRPGLQSDRPRAAAGSAAPSSRSTSSIARSPPIRLSPKPGSTARRCCSALGRRDQAIESFDRAIALDPRQCRGALRARDRAAARGSRRGRARRSDGRDCAESGLRARSREPRLPAQPAWTVRRGLRRRRARAASLRRTTTTSAITRRWCNCCTGNGATDGANFEARLTAPSLDSARTFIPPPYPRWRGEPPGDYLLVLLTEQGRGDVIQFARFATERAQCRLSRRDRDAARLCVDVRRRCRHRARHHRHRRTRRARPVALGHAGERRRALSA